MEKYVVSRELAEQLKTAGYPQDSQFTYETFTMVTGRKVTQLTHGLPHVDTSIYTAAPLSDELLEQLPEGLQEDESYFLASLFIEPSLTGWSTGYRKGAAMAEVKFSSDKPADALAQLWLWCKENGYIK